MVYFASRQRVRSSIGFRKHVLAGRADEGVQRNVNEMMEFILVADVSNALLRTKVCLERGALNCTQKWRGLDYRSHNLSHPSGMP